MLARRVERVAPPPGRQVGMIGQGISIRWMVVFVICAVTVVAGWVTNGVADLTRSIFGAPMIVSRSMEDHEIVLRTAFGPHPKPLPEEATPYEWRLVVPRAYLVSEIGNNGEVYRANIKKNNRWYDGPGRARGDSYFARLHSVIDPQGREMKPAVLATEEELRTSFVGVTTANKGLFPNSPVRNYCVRDDDVNSYFKGYGAAFYRTKCPDVMPRCTINTILDGWDIELTVSRRLYSEPESMCRLARTFLDKYTVKRDQIN